MRLRQLTEELTARKFILEVQAALLDKHDGVETKLGKTHADELALFVWASDMAHGMDNLYLYYEAAEDTTDGKPRWRIMNDGHRLAEDYVDYKLCPLTRVIDMLYEGLLQEVCIQADIDYADTDPLKQLMKSFLLPGRASIKDVSEEIVERTVDPEEVAEKAESYLLGVRNLRNENQHKMALLLVKDTGK